MTFAPKRRWFCYSLRTLFVVVTVAGCAVAWISRQYDWIQQRREVLARGDCEVPLMCYLELHEWNYPPWPLGWFGGEAAGFPELWLPKNTSDGDLSRVQRLFPETDVRLKR